ncbi:hypothetical protein Y032_0940g3137 [Ancylostoma ceylanicum]|uniref:Uncharacterized protein n=1 Tax=Ancylostoma ceylanicum TaxID=53326 RepID=A0A016W9Y1_9BILA|nr:hypothetical protein Y032_0940g3137 [Ancylostoma ceylanicum]
MSEEPVWRYKWQDNVFGDTFNGCLAIQMARQNIEDRRTMEALSESTNTLSQNWLSGAAGMRCNSIER